MAFWGDKFIFNGVPCEDYDLMIYDIGGESAGDSSFASAASIIEESVGKRIKPYFYGVEYKDKLTFDMVFGVNEDRIDAHQYLDRYEISEIASWLTGHDKYMWLEIDQEDMPHVRYNCMITGLKTVSYDRIPYALRATVTCDGPYAYMYPQDFKYVINGTSQIAFYNESSANQDYRPVIEFELGSGETGFSIENMTDNGRTLTFTDIPAAVGTVTVDNDTCVITNDQDLNIYGSCNMNWLRLKRGYNILNVVGNGTLTIKCKFYVNAGG